MTGKQPAEHPGERLVRLSQAGLLPNKGAAKLPAVYESAKNALAECSRVDECKDWADKMAALASYAKQADDDSLYKTAMRIQARAQRRAGELLAEMDPGRGGRPSGKPMSSPTQVSRSKAAREAGLSPRQKNTALRVANIPKEEFETAVDSEEPPTITALAERGKKSRPKTWDIGDRDPREVSLSTDAQGRLRDLAEVALKISAGVAVRGAFERERPTMKKRAVEVMDWCRLLIKEIGEHE